MRPKKEEEEKKSEKKKKEEKRGEEKAARKTGRGKKGVATPKEDNDDNANDNLVNGIFHGRKGEYNVLCTVGMRHPQRRT